MQHDYGYCVKCRKMTKTRDARYVTTSRGRCIPLMKRIKLPWAKFPGELHLPGHTFTEPGTRLDMRLNSDDTPKSWWRPINRIEKASYRHDPAYAKHSDVANRNEADRKMIKELDDIKKPMLRERAERSTVKRILKTKVNFRM